MTVLNNEIKEEDSQIAQISSKILANYLSDSEERYKLQLRGESNNNFPDGDAAQTSSVGDHTEEVTIPAVALKMLLEILRQMGAGRAIKIVPVKQEVSQQEAANILNVSLPYLVNLLESGAIAQTNKNTGDKILYEDVIAYKNKIDALRRQTLAELTAQAQELNMGYE